MSYGVIVFRVRGVSWPLEGGILDPQMLSAGLEYFLIQRRDSIGFVEIMRGKYKVQETEYIKQQIAGMTERERRVLLEEPFEKLWESLWGAPQHGSHSYRHEKENARGKLEALRKGGVLAKLIETAPPAWKTPEWGFPKGRRDLGESEYTCAMRELWEETNLKEQDILPIRGLDTFVESFQGSNQVHYTHKYFLAFVPPGVGEETFAEVAPTSEHIRREIGDFAWLRADEAVARIRPDAKEKRELLLRVHGLLRNYALVCPRPNNP
jgi:8-oxo-dGTP pyrophosphatase MutT (NUDIX family)